MGEKIEVSFVQFIGQLNLQAQIALGIIQNPVTGKYERNLEVAKYHIDILGMLEEKTKGNLSKEEENYLKTVLTDLRMRYVFENEEREKLKKESKESKEDKGNQNK